MGKWEEAGGLNNYVTGPESSKKGLLLVVYDAFGMSSQAIQGAYRLSNHLQELVIMPDFFKGNTLDHNQYIRDPAKYMPVMRDFMRTHADIEANTKAVVKLPPALKSRFPSVESWSVYGLCWGGKVAVMASISEHNPFKASGQAHPSRLAAEDARALTIPHICQASKDESDDVVTEYEKILAEKKMGKVERVSTMFHGWMGARANLADDDNRQEYQRGYLMAAEFFAEHL